MSRWIHGVLGLAAGVGLIVALMVALPTDGRWSMILLGRSSDALPWTIQSALWLMLGLGLGEAAFRRARARAESTALDLGLLPDDDSVLGPDGMPELLTACREAPRESHLVALIERCILQFQSSRSVSDTHHLLMSMTELRMHRVELDYSLLRYLGWLIPTVGFIGTVYGIAEALTALVPSDAAGAAMEAVIGPLSTAFYSTFVALLASAALMLVAQRVQRVEEAAINDSAGYCLYNLINRLFVPGGR